MIVEPATQAPAHAPPSEHLEAPTCDGAARVYQPDEFEHASWGATYPGGAQPPALRGADGSANPQPEAGGTHQLGSQLLGFRLLKELGQGAFGRVFLAQQGDLADREVVLKVSPSVEVESRILARLQHTNIVPIYSIHRAGALQAVCMPYFGSTTLAHVMQGLADRPSLPQTGEALLVTIQGRRSTLGNAPSTKGPRPEAPAPVAPLQETAELSGANGPVEILQGLSYVDAVLWIGARLADGLAHAHDRGIIHRDLKPANVLITDEGQPMLLDFNMAQDTRRDVAALAQVGGTLPYMAPEQLDALKRDAPLVDATGDVYSLGVILYELLAGCHPFVHYHGPVREVLTKMIQERQGPPPSLRRWNRDVSPAVEAIVRNCLEPERARRYRSARELKEDLERQLENLPLKHVPEPSIRERASKWMRRHPKLGSMTTLGAVAGVILVALLGLVVARGERLADVQAQSELNRFLEERKAAQYHLTARTGDAAQLDAGVQSARGLLARYGVLDGVGRGQTRATRRLSAADRESFDAAVSELLLLLSRGVALQAAERQDAPGRDEALAEALRLNELAESWGDEPGSRALWQQRAEIYRLLGRPGEARLLYERAEATPLRTAADHYLVAADLLSKGRHRQALPILLDASAQFPQDFWCWFLLGVCYDSLGQSGDAIACYGTCLAITPDSPWAYFNRGLAELRIGRGAQAEADFDRVIALRPAMIEAYCNRALARITQKKYDDAVKDLDEALALGADPVYVLFLRADARQRAGDQSGALKDREEGMRHEPTDEKGWLSRGYARLGSDPKGALADFDQALRLNPRSLVALQNKAHVLSKLGRDRDAVAALDKVVEVYPDFVRARAGRAVLRARLKQRSAAHDDAEECLTRDKAPLVAYQLAGVYALTSRDEPADRKEAFRLLSSALRRGVGFDLLESDKDLAPIRDSREFKKLVEAAQALRAAPAERADKR
jgi:serine/threonine protein kinase/tetratricopeptide (TPR) repeat protein